MAATGIAASMTGAVIPNRAEAAKKLDIGEIKGLKIDVLTETSWFNNDIFKKNIMDYGGAMTCLLYTSPSPRDHG